MMILINLNYLYNMLQTSSYYKKVIYITIINWTYGTEF